MGLWVEDNNKRIILKLKVRHVEEESNQLMQGYIFLKITYPNIDSFRIIISKNKSPDR